MSSLKEPADTHAAGRLSEERCRPSTSDLVKVNVGGKVFQTQRATLLSAEGSLLEAVFSGRWQQLVRDEAGNVFFDFDPAPFRALLNYLRTRSLAGPGQAVPPPHVPLEHKAQFEAMISFMGLQEVISGHSPALPEEAMALTKVSSRSGPDIHIRGGHLTSHELSRCARSVVGGAPLLQDGAWQKLAWKVSILQFSGLQSSGGPPSQSVLAGVTANPAPPDCSYGDTGTYGWASTPEPQVCTGGVGPHGARYGWLGWQRGDVAIFQLDGHQQVLRMHLRRTGQVYTLPLPADVVRSARLHFNLKGGTSVELTQITPRELADVGF